MSTKILPRNPEIRKLLKSFETMPEFLAERRRKIFEKQEFQRRVFEDAVRKAGLLEKFKNNSSD